jgi:drug/metabolite transporter, DME family
MLGIALALVSAAASGLSVVLVRKYSAGSNAFNMSLIITCVGMAVLWPLALVTPEGALGVEGFVFFAVSGVLSPGIVRLFYYKGLQKLGVSGNSAVFSVYPLYSTLLAVVLLSEVLFLEDWAGIACIVVGVVFIELSMHGSNGGSGYGGRKNLVFPILGGVMLGVSSITRKYALNYSDTPVLGVAIAYTFSLLPYLVMLSGSFSTRRNLSLKRDLRWFWAAGIGQAVAWTLAFYALSYDQVSIVTPILSAETLFVVAFAHFYLGELEKVSRKMMASIAITIAGVVLVSL